MSISVSKQVTKEYLIAQDEHYRSLASEHHKYDLRLRQLADLHYPSEDEQAEEIILKKKKLLLKDQMESIAHKYEVSASH